MPRSGHGLTVLTYHRIGAPDAGPPGILSATPEDFARHMDWLARSGRAVTLEDVVAAVDGVRPLRRGAVLVTFDDAYDDFATLAWPVLRDRGIRPVLFVPTGFPDAPEHAFWWDRLYGALRAGEGRVATAAGTLDLTGPEARVAAYRTVREQIKALPHDEAMGVVDAVVDQVAPGGAAAGAVLGWDALRALHAEGVDLAPHTRTHPRLDRLPAAALAQEVQGSLHDLRRELGALAVAPAFAYPSGGVSAEGVAAVRDAGIRVAFTTERGTNDLRTADPLRLARINVGRRTNVALLRLQAALPARPAIPLRPSPTAPDAPPPSIAYIMSRFPKISETFILTEMLAMERAGVRVEVYPLIRERAGLVHPEARPVVDRAHFQPVVSPAILASHVHFLRRDARGYLGALRDIVRGTLGSTNFLFGALASFPKVVHMARLMEADGITHVHAHFATHPALAAFVVHRLTGIPYSFTGHGSDLHVERRMLPEKVAEAAFVATVSEYNRKLIVDECGGRFEDKVHIVRAGVDTSKFAAAPGVERAPADGPLRIVMVGTLHEVKGQVHLVEACRLLVARGIDVEARLIGEGEDRAMLEGRIAEAGLEGKVTLVGAATGQEVAAEMRRAHVLAAPSVPTKGGKREGIPVVLMEAMSSGLPVVSSDLSGIPELVVHEVAGILTQPGDAAAIADALARLHADPALRERLGAAGRARIEEEFSVQRSVERLAAQIGLTLPEAQERLAA